jgi:hypothetical protein
LGALGARAEGFAFRKSVAIGKPAREVSVVVDVSPEGTLLELGRARSPLPVTDPQRAELTRVTLTGGTAVGVLHVYGAGNREAAALLVRGSSGEPRIAWTGALDLRGDPGERSASALDVRTVADQSEIVVGDVDERVRICGQPRTLLHPRALDPSSLQLKALRSSPLAPSLPGQPTPTDLAAKAEAPGLAGPPLLPALRTVASSGADAASSAGAATSLTDGSAATYWSSSGSGEFTTLHVDSAGYPITALALTLLPASLPAGASVMPPRSLLLVGDSGARIHVQLPDAPSAGARYYVVPQQPLPWSCLSIVLDAGGADTAKSNKPTVLAEVEAYTELDAGGGADRLIRDLVAGGSRGSRAASLLARLPEVGGKLRAAWPQLSATARRQAVRAVAASAEKQASSRELLATAFDDREAEVSKAAFEALIAAGPQARALLLPMVARVDASGDGAALGLARHAPREATPAILGALRGEGLQRRALHEALSLAVQAGGDEVVSSIRAWAAGADAEPASRAVVALVLSRLDHPEGARVLAAELAGAEAPKASAFEDRWRWVAAARALPASPALDVWLSDLARREEHWMLRASALEALAERHATERLQVALDALDHDDYPRVRVAAAQALAKDPSALGPLTTHAGRDSWPMVRAAALEALADQNGSRQALELGLDDRTHQVRAAAVRSLERAGSRASWPAVAKRLEDKDEWSEVKTEVVHFARTFCIQEAAGPLLGLLRKGMSPDAGTEDADLALVAFEAVSQLGGEPARKARAMAGSASAPDAFKASAAAQASRKPECTAAQ